MSCSTLSEIFTLFNVDALIAFCAFNADTAPVRVSLEISLI